MKPFKTKSPDAMAVVDEPNEVRAKELPEPNAEDSKDPKLNVVLSPALIPVWIAIVGVLPFSSETLLK